MIENYRITQIGTLFSEGIEDQALPPLRRRRGAKARFPVRVLGLLQDAMAREEDLPRTVPVLPPVREAQQKTE